MTDDRSDPSVPIDAEYEPAETPAVEENRSEETSARAVQKTRGPGWFSFFVLLLVSLSALGLGLWSSGLLQRGLKPSPEATGLAAMSDRQDDIAGRLKTLEEQTASLSGKLGDLEGKISQKPNQTPVNTAQLKALETRISDLESRIENATGGPADTARLDRLEAAIETAGEGSGATSSDLTALRQQVNALRGELQTLKQAQSGLKQQIGTLSKADADAEARGTARTQAALALSAIEAASAAGEPFAADLAQALKSRTNSPAADALVTLAGKPIPTVEALSAQFSTLRPEALKTVTAPAEPSWMDNFFGDMVNVRRSDPESPAAKQLESAAQAIEAGRLPQAVEAIADLPDEPRSVFTDWLTGARARVQLDRNLDAVRLNLISDGP